MSIFPKTYNRNRNKFMDYVITVGTDKLDDAEYKKLERYLYTYDTLFYNQAVGKSNVLQH